MKAEKKENLEKMRVYKQILEKNKKVNRLNIFVLIAGLALSALELKIGDYLLWAGVFVFITTIFSSLFARGSMRKIQR
ncbi:MAG: hypothetical protein PHV51_11460 [Methanosarcinaceae archaeon]|nr:hypothetical protein [Methanosarcinaceae archaeon]MDD4498736.1 hypothetical protein [Methanosarcinaceae archaeon]